MSKQRAFWGTFKAENAYPCAVLADEAGVKCKLDLAPVCIQSSAILHTIELMLCKVDRTCEETHPKHSIVQVGQLFCIHRTVSALQ